MKIAVVTGSRADYGLQRPVVRVLAADPAFAVTWIATGSHLSPAHGDTVGEIEADAIAAIERVPMLLGGDDAASVAKSMGLALIGFGDVLARLKPDLVMVLGDRYEILAAVSAALVARIPVAHLCGGDVTEGAFDDAIRHAITKLANLHFPMTEESAGRLRQMGEDVATIHVIGHPGLDDLAALAAPDRAETERVLGFTLRRRNLLVTLHPETAADRNPEVDAAALLGALDSLGPDVGLLFTAPNADPAGQRIANQIEAFVRTHANACLFASLGRSRYLDVMRQMDAVVGNSSSGLLEAPSFAVPTVNIGDRQKGRLAAHSVITVTADGAEIRTAIDRAFAIDRDGIENPYGTPGAPQRVHRVLRALSGERLRALTRKRFHDYAGVK